MRVDRRTQMSDDSIELYDRMSEEDTFHTSLNRLIQKDIKVKHSDFIEHISHMNSIFMSRLKLLQSRANYSEIDLEFVRHIIKDSIHLFNLAYRKGDRFHDLTRLSRELVRLYSVLMNECHHETGVSCL